MEISKQQLVELEQFQKNLADYHDAANAVWDARKEYASGAISDDAKNSIVAHKN